MRKILLGGGFYLSIYEYCCLKTACGVQFIINFHLKFHKFICRIPEVLILFEECNGIEKNLNYRFPIFLTNLGTDLRTVLYRFRKFST